VNHTDQTLVTWQDKTIDTLQLRTAQRGGKGSKPKN
jgi:hypothetical protein